MRPVTLEIAFLLGLLAVMVYVFLSEALPIDLTAFLGLLILILAGYVTPAEAFNGFSSPAVITMLAVFFVSAGLLQTGVAEVVGSAIHHLAGGREARLIALIMLVAGMLSAFMNNIAATAVLLPAVASAARRSELSPSKLFIPLSFGGILGGTMTLIGTPPNILTAQVLQERGFRPLALFDFTPIGLLLLGVGTLYMVTLGRRLLPQQTLGERTARAVQNPAQVYRLEERLFSIRLPRDWPLSGSSLRQTRLGSALGVQVVGIIRDGSQRMAPNPDATLHGGDILLVQGRQADVQETLRVQGLQLQAEAVEAFEEPSQEVGVVRARVPAGSPLAGRTLRELRFRERYGLVVLAIQRQGLSLRENLGSIRLEEEDEILLLGSASDTSALAGDPDLRISEGRRPGILQLHEQLFLIHVPAGSPLVGQTVGQSRMGELVGLVVAGIIRDGRTRLAVTPGEVIQANDRLLVSGEPERLARLLAMGQLEVEPAAGRAQLESEAIGVVEAALAPRSELAGRTPAQLEFRDRYGLTILAVWREGRPVRTGIAQLPLRFGDALLLQGPRRKIEILGGDPDFLVLSEMAEVPRRRQRAPLAVASLLLLVVTAVAGWLPIHVAAFAAAVAMVLSGSLTMEEAYRAIEWRAIFLVAAILPVGVAMERSGAAQLLADTVIAVTGPLGPYAVLAGLGILSSLLSQGLDGAPTVVLLAPVALETASQLGLQPYPLMVIVGLAASVAFMTPFSHKANLLVMGAGGYRAMDYLRVGTPLSLVVLALLIWAVPIFFPL